MTVATRQTTPDAVLFAALALNANWQLADDGSLDTILHCTNCGHAERFSAREYAADFLGREEECPGLDEWERSQEGADDIFDCADERAMRDDSPIAISGPRFLDPHDPRRPYSDDDDSDARPATPEESAAKVDDGGNFYS